MQLCMCQKRFYCKTVLIGKWKSSQCSVPSESCSDALSNKAKFDDAFEGDLGEFWNDTAKELVDSLALTLQEMSAVVEQSRVGQVSCCLCSSSSRQQ